MTKLVMGWFLVASAWGASANAGEPIHVIQIRGSINPASANYLKSGVENAGKTHSAALIVELDTPGGLISSVRDMAQAIDDSSVPVIVYTTPAGASATSAGALLMLASHISAMAPGTAIGAAHPVDSNGKDISGSMGEKVLNDTAAFARGLAELRGRNRDLAEAVVRKSQSYTVQEAFDKKLIEIIAKDREDLLKQLDGREVVLKVGSKVTLHTLGSETSFQAMTYGQRLLDFLANPTVAALLMSFSLLCIYVEITTAGFGLAGVLGAISLLVAFMSFQMLPIRMGGLLLMVLGMGFLVAEAFVVTKGALAFGGAISFILGILWVMDPTQTSLRVSPAVWVPMAMFMLGGAIGLGWLLRRMKAQVAEATSGIGGTIASGLHNYEGTVSVVDFGGLRGKVEIRGETWDFDSSEKLVVGDRVQIERTEGMRAQVKKSSNLRH